MEIEKTLKILMLEDNADDAFLIQRTLRKDELNFVSECVDTKEEFKESIKRFRPDVILSDHGLPGFNSKEALGIALQDTPFSPFILVTGTVSDEYAISCLRQGADDYILKSNLARLPMAIRGAVKKRRIERLKREARHALRQQNQELLKANQELDNFVYSVSHNLRGPLASLMGLLNIARSSNHEAELRQVLSMMDTSFLKLDETLKEIVEYSRNARNEIHLELVNWSQVVESALKKVGYLDELNQINTNVEVKNGSVFYSDTNRLVNVMTNLLSNSMIFRAPGRENTVNIEILSLEECATISITDNGIGIREDILPKIGQMFYRGNEISRGAGLGIYIAKEIVGRLDGEFSITSKYSLGTTVNIRIPNHKICDPEFN